MRIGSVTRMRKKMMMIGMVKMRLLIGRRRMRETVIRVRRRERMMIEYCTVALQHNSRWHIHTMLSTTTCRNALLTSWCPRSIQG